MQAIKSECRRILSLQYSDIDFTPIQKISLRDLSEVIRREKAVATVAESHSTTQTGDVDPAAEVTMASTFARGPLIGGSSAPPSLKE